MILEEATKEAYGYLSSELKAQSGKYIIVACELCDKIRMVRRDNYRYLCSSCAQKCKHLSEETKIKIGAAMKGNTHALGHNHTEETKAKLSAANKGKKNYWFGRNGEKSFWFGKQGKDAPNFKGGRKAADARRHAKRRRELSYTLLMPLKDSEVGHHITNEYVIGIPVEVHLRFGGYSRKQHRTLVLNWLKNNDKKKYIKVLCVLAKQSL